MRTFLVRSAPEDGYRTELVRAETVEEACGILVRDIYPGRNPSEYRFEPSDADGKRNEVWYAEEVGDIEATANAVVPLSDVTLWERPI